MKFAFSTKSCPEWDFPTIAEKAREFGYEGVEISGATVRGTPGRLTPGDPAGILDVLGAFTSASIEIACIAAPIRLTGHRRADVEGAKALCRWIDLSAELACPRVMVRDPEPRRGMSGLATGMALGEWLAPVADQALARGIILVVRNDATLTSARLMWAMLERLRHPAVACCWDLGNAVRVGESPALSVPTLNSQIRYARIGPSPAAAAPREPRSGCDVQLFLTRLRGIGYDGYVSAAGSATEVAGPPVNLPAVSLPAVSLPAVSVSNPSNPSSASDEYLAEMAAMLNKWGRPLSATARRKQETRPKAG